MSPGIPVYGKKFTKKRDTKEAMQKGLKFVTLECAYFYWICLNLNIESIFKKYSILC